ncbi:hypothetical protein [Paenibacillus odorifer]|uniref:hypothetical protein n=1 Tax=Paenibacillus odorifer TaxID=189426 RepID=UPI00096CEE3C|nr:hypothetical protein [Paenibacillus odorifer]OMD66201.1 hypothetical protein BSK50_30810 [Paenibacillus odorifer]
MKLSEIQGFDSKEILFMVKFTQERFVESLVNGNLYMNPIKYFVELEEKTKIKGQGDKFEGANVIRDFNFTLYKHGTKEKVGEGYSDLLVERNHYYDDLPIFCITAFTPQDFKVVNETDEILSLVFDLDEQDKSVMEETFGEKAIVINAAEFMNSVDAHMINNNLAYSARLVDYFDYSVNHEARIRDYGKSVSSLFVKDDFFKHQREYRIALLDQRKDEGFNLKIDNFNIKMPLVLETKDFFENFGLDVRKRS